MEIYLSCVMDFFDVSRDFRRIWNSVSSPFYSSNVMALDVRAVSWERFYKWERLTAWGRLINDR